jgi:hypothetical protein
MSLVDHADSARKRSRLDARAQAYARSVISSRQLNWRLNGEGFALHFERRLTALLHVVRDNAYAGMWRVKFADGSFSDMANVTRAKDAGRAHGLATFNRKLDYQETARQASPIRLDAIAAGGAPSQAAVTKPATVADAATTVTGKPTIADFPAMTHGRDRC